MQPWFWRLVLISSNLVGAVHANPALAYHLTGVIDQNGKIVIESKYRSVRYLGQRYFLVEDLSKEHPKKASMIGHVTDYSGNILKLKLPDGCTLTNVYLPAAYGSAEVNNTNLPTGTILQIHSRNGFGLCDESGRILLEPRFNFIGQRKGDSFPVCAIRNNRQYLAFLFNATTKQHLSVPANARLQETTDSDLFKFEVAHNPGRSGLWGCMTKDGKVVIEPHYRGITNFSSDGIAVVGLANKKACVYISKSDKVLSPSFLRAEPFEDGLANVAIQTDGSIKWGVIDRRFEFVLKPIYDRIFRPFSDVFAVATSKHGTFKAVDKTGNVLFDLPKGTAYVHKFTNDRFKCQLTDSVTKKTVIAFIDRNGTIRETIDNDKHGLPVPRQKLEFGFVKISKLVPGQGYIFGLINQSGNEIQPMQTASFRPVSEDRVIRFESVDHFSKNSWINSDPDGIGWGLNRLSEFANFLRDHDLIGMTRDQVGNFLGSPENHNMYYLSYPGCGSGFLAFEIEYEDEKVKRWREQRSIMGRKFCGNWVFENMVFDPQIRFNLKPEDPRLVLYPKMTDP